jgi:hypothetical protein
VKFGVVDFYRVSDEQGDLFRKLLIVVVWRCLLAVHAL